MPQWHLRVFNLSVVHVGNRYIPRQFGCSRNSPANWYQLFSRNSLPTPFSLVSTHPILDLETFFVASDVSVHRSLSRGATFELELHRAECEFLTGQSSAAEERLAMLSSRAATPVELATVTCLYIDLYTTLVLTVCCRKSGLCPDFPLRLPSPRRT